MWYVRLWIALVILACSAAAGAATTATPCGLRLERAQANEITFRTPPGGQALRRAFAGRFLSCTLTRRDGSRFARLVSDKQQRILAVAFYRRNGKLLRSTDATHLDTGATVKCGSGSHTSIGPGYWTTTRKWRVGSTPSGLKREAVVKAVRNAQSEWTNNKNYCGIADHASPPAAYQEGKTSAKATKQDGVNVVDWGPLNGQDCPGAAACAYAWYDANGRPIESDIRFSTDYTWSTTGSSNALDVQTFAAHEIGHSLQFDHVTSSSKDDQTNVLWPYLSRGDTSGRKLGRGDALADNAHY